MEKSNRKIIGSGICLLVMCLGNNCTTQGDQRRESRVPEDKQLQAIDPVPEELDSRNHPVLKMLNDE